MKLISEIPPPSFRRYYLNKAMGNYQSDLARARVWTNIFLLLTYEQMKTDLGGMKNLNISIKRIYDNNLINASFKNFYKLFDLFCKMQRSIASTKQDRIIKENSLRWEEM